MRTMTAMTSTAPMTTIAQMYAGAICCGAGAGGMVMVVGAGRLMVGAGMVMVGCGTVRVGVGAGGMVTGG